MTREEELRLINNSQVRLVKSGASSFQPKLDPSDSGKIQDRKANKQKKKASKQEPAFCVLCNEHFISYALRQLHINKHHNPATYKQEAREAYLDLEYVSRTNRQGF